MIGARCAVLARLPAGRVAATAAASGARHGALPAAAAAIAAAAGAAGRRHFTGGLLRRHSALTSNKEGLSRELDATVMAMAGNDAREFAMGFWRSCKSREDYTRFMLAHYFLYGALERAFAAQPADSPVARLWRACPELRGAQRKLQRDLRAVGVDGTSAAPSAAAAAYVAAVEEASADGAVLVGHFYCRYFPDLLCGDSLGQAARLANGLPRGRPEFYTFPAEVEDNRVAYVEHMYGLLNVEGERMGPEARARAVEGARDALALNAAVYAEASKRPLIGAVRGVTKFASGYISHLLFRDRPGASEECGGAVGVLLPTARRDVSPAWQ